MEIGMLIKSKLENSKVVFRGNVQTMTHSIQNFELIKNPMKKEESKRPDYLIFLLNSEDVPLEIGAAWHHEYEKEGEMRELVSLSFDDPSFDSPLHVTAFKGDDEHRWPISWKRRKAA